VETYVYAVQQIRQLRGGSQPQLFRASDGLYYVIKPQNNPQHVRVLANEMLATRLGLLLGLPLPSVQPIEVSDWLIEQTPALRIKLIDSSTPWKAGMHQASRYIGHPTKGWVFDYLPDAALGQLDNLRDFARVLVLDRWTSNVDGRQAVFSRREACQRYAATFVDQGYCFNGGEWTFADTPLRGVYGKNCVYEHVTGWDAFEPTITRAEQMNIDHIWRIAAEIPEEWYEFDNAGLNWLAETLYKRRSRIRELITTFRTSSRNPFPNWVTD